MNTKQKIAVMKYSDALELFEQALAAIKQCDNILHRMKTIKYSAEREGSKADVRAAEKEIKSYTEKLEKLNIDALFCAHEVMRHAAITAEFGYILECSTLDKAQKVIDGTK